VIPRFSYLNVAVNLCTELALVIAEFGQTMSDIAQSDVGKVLARALSGLADVERKAQDIQDRQSRQDVMTIMSTGTTQYIDVFHMCSVLPPQLTSTPG
jgi:hypothetical protein